MNRTEYEGMRCEIEDEKYLEWEMKQPGYWRYKILVVLAGITILVFVWFAI